MMKSFWAKGPSRMGFTSVYVVDEHGCLLNTEPACSVPDRYGDWFMGWLMQQPCPYPTFPPLLEHVPSFPAPKADEGPGGVVAAAFRLVELAEKRRQTYLYPHQCPVEDELSDFESDGENTVCLGCHGEAWRADDIKHEDGCAWLAILAAFRTARGGEGEG